MSRRSLPLIVVAVLTVVALTGVLRADASTWTTTQQTSIPDPGANAADNLGGYTFVCPFCLGAAAISADGTTALVGAPGTTNGAGAAYVFVKSGGTWSQQANLVTLVPAPGNFASFGDAVALSTDGNTALVSQPTGPSPGVAYVFTRTGGTWTKSFELSTVASPAPAGFDTFGAYVALSGDGHTAVVGADGANNYTGQVYVFTGSGSSWAQQATLSADTSPAVTPGANFGEAVSISSDGNTIAAGAPGNDPGRAYVFGRTSGTWAQVGAELSTISTPAPTGFFQFGFSVALSGDGQTVVVGAIRGNAGKGAAYLYTRSGSTWTQATELSTDLGSPLLAGAFFGSAVALNGAGTMAVVGANSGTGHAYDFALNGTTWSEVDDLAALSSTSPAPSAGSGFGTAVAMSADPSILVAAPRQGTGGVLYVFSATTTTTSALASSAKPAVAGTTVTFTDTVCGATPTGTVTFSDGSTSLGTGTLAPGGGAGCSRATLATASLAAGSHTIGAVYAGDPSNTGSSATLTQTITAAIPVPQTGALGGWPAMGLPLGAAGVLLTGAVVAASRRRVRR